jgi:hypothetical protein
LGQFVPNLLATLMAALIPDASKHVFLTKKETQRTKHTSLYLGQVLWRSGRNINA